MSIGVDSRERCESASEGAALGLLGLMSGISEEYWCAGWLHGLEFDLWDAATNANDSHFRITPRQASLLRLLSEECDGWWYWREDADDNPQFVPLNEWRSLLDRRAGGD